MSITGRMRKEFFKYLKSYSYDPTAVNRIIVSSFLYANNIKGCNNLLIEDLRIKKGDADYEQLEQISKTYSIATLEDLVEVFEFVISPEEKIVSGAVYTPDYIREYIVQQVVNIATYDEDFKICDPACGCSGFLLTAVKKIREATRATYSNIYRNHLYGLDIQRFSVERSEILLSLAAIIDGEDLEKFDFNIYLGNALDFSWNENIEGFSGFDAVIGNPPYVCSRNIEEESRSLVMHWAVSQSGHPDLYIPFFEIGISNLRPDGTLGFITMNTFFKSVNGRALREYFQQQKLRMDIIDFGAFQVFESKSTYTCICIIQNTTSDFLNYIRLSDSSLLLTERFEFQSIEYDDLNFENGWNLQEKEILNKIEGIGTPLGEKFTSRNGIATLKNNVYIFNPVDEDRDYYYLDNGQTFQIERGICAEVINPNKLTKINSIEGLRKKIIFPYYYENGQAIILPEDEFINRFPKAYNYLITQRKVLASRDKGKGKDYRVWYSYGRNQSLEQYEYKLFFPHIAPSTPNFVLNNDPELLFVNGLAIIGDNLRELEYLKKVMSSRLFWYYIVNSSKPYGSGYYSLSRNYIKNFGIYEFTEEQINYIIEAEHQDLINVFLEELYGVDLLNKVVAD